MSELAELIREKLRDGADAFLCLRDFEGTVIPALITEEDAEELDGVRLGSQRYPLQKILARLQKRYPDKRFAVLARGCDERAMMELAKLDQLDLDRVIMVGVACTGEEAEACGCGKPYPSEVELGERVEAEPDRGVIDEVEGLSPSERLRWWSEQFSRCIKCYGCRNICPMCFCEECALENPQLVEPGVIPPEFPSFHVIRAIDMAGRCIDCGLCEEACPAGIPLRGLYRKMREIMEDSLGYRPGESAGDKNPLSFLGSEKDIEKLQMEG